MSNKKKRIILIILTVMLSAIILVYFSFDSPQNSLAVPYLCNNGKYILVDSESMKPINTKEFDSEIFNIDRRALKQDSTLEPIYINGKYGYLNNKFNLIVPPKYEYAHGFCNGLAMVEIESEKRISAYINSKGQEVIFLHGAILNNILHDFSEGVAWIDGTSGFTLINKLGKELTNKPYELPPYENLYFREGLSCFSLNGKIGYLNPKGEEIIPAKYINGTSFENGVACVQINGELFGRGNFKLINKHGVFLKTDVSLDNIIQIPYFVNGVCWIEKVNEMGILENSGHYIKTIKFEEASEFYDGLAGVKLNNKWGVINKKGKMIISPKYDDIGSFEDGFCKVKLKGKWGYINLNGKLILPAIYEFTEDYSSIIKGLFVVKLNGKYGVINKFGTEIIPIKYNYIECNLCYDGFYRAEKDNKSFFIDRRGREYRDIKTK
jgi:hypothetical protein